VKECGKGEGVESEGRDASERTSRAVADGFAMREERRESSERHFSGKRERSSFSTLKGRGVQEEEEKAAKQRSREILDGKTCSLRLYHCLERNTLELEEGRRQ
jgi:hypothetical protein